MRLLAQVIPAGPFPLTQVPQQPLPDRRPRLGRGDAVVGNTVLTQALRLWGRGQIHGAQQRGDMDEQRFGVRRVGQLGLRRRVRWVRLGDLGERGAGVAEVFGPAGQRDRMAVQVQDCAGVGQLLLADQPVPPLPCGPRQQQQPGRRPRIIPPQVLD